MCSFCSRCSRSYLEATSQVYHIEDRYLLLLPVHIEEVKTQNLVEGKGLGKLCLTVNIWTVPRLACLALKLVLNIVQDLWKCSCCSQGYE